MFFARRFLFPFRLGHLLDSVVGTYFARRFLPGVNNAPARVGTAAARPAASAADEERARVLFPHRRLTPVQYVDSQDVLCLWKPYLSMRFRDERLNRWLAAVAAVPPLAPIACEQYARTLFPYGKVSPSDWAYSAEGYQWTQDGFGFDRMRYRDGALDRWIHEVGEILNRQTAAPAVSRLAT